MFITEDQLFTKTNTQHGPEIIQSDSKTVPVLTSFHIYTILLEKFNRPPVIKSRKIIYLKVRMTLLFIWQLTD